MIVAIIIMLRPVIYRPLAYHASFATTDCVNGNSYCRISKEGTTVPKTLIRVTEKYRPFHCYDVVERKLYNEMTLVLNWFLKSNIHQDIFHFNRLKLEKLHSHNAY